MIERAVFALACYQVRTSLYRRQDGSIVVGELQPQRSSGLCHDVVANLAANMQQVVNICDGWIAVRSSQIQQLDDESKYTLNNGITFTAATDWQCAMTCNNRVPILRS